jgi:hypothetical protein
MAPVSTLPTATPESTLTASPGAACPHRYTAAGPEGERPAADRFVRRVLRISDAQPRLGEDELRSAFSRSILVSATRCILTYLVIPFLAPVLGLATGVGPLIGIPVGLLAIVFNVKSIRRFWRADHRWRWAYTAIGGTVIVLLLVLIARDLVELLT